MQQASRLLYRTKIRARKALRDWCAQDADPGADGTPLLTLMGGAAVGISVIVVASGIHMISALTNPPSLALAHAPTFGEGDENYKWGHSTALSAEEELCITRLRGSTPYLYCSPSFDKGRLPGGKLISDRLPEVGQDTQFQLAAPVPSSFGVLGTTVAANPYWGSPGETAPSKDMAVQYGWYQISLPSRAPENLRLIRNEQAADARAEQLPQAQTKSKRCKARSYWSVKHGECRRRRGRGR